MKPNCINRVLAGTCAALGVALPLISTMANAAVTPTVLHTFTGTPDGAYPVGGLVLGTDGALYGTTDKGGQYADSDINANGNGTLFRVAADGSYSLLHSFNFMRQDRSNSGGARPQTALQPTADGSVYGTTTHGGINGTGVIFQYSSSGGFATAHDYPPSTDSSAGTYPFAAPTLGLDGVLYGTTSNGGTFSHGTMYRFAPDTDTYQVLRSFGAPSAPLGVPSRLLAASDGQFYGLSEYVSAKIGNPELFRLSADGTQFKVLHLLQDGVEGNYLYGGWPVMAPTEGPDGQLYGITTNGGSGGTGTVFRIARDGSGSTVLHAFSAVDKKQRNADGARPSSSLLLGSDGRLYGTTITGGLYGSGVLFRITPDSDSFEVLFNYPAASPDGTSVGVDPRGDLAFDSKGNLCGTTSFGGTADMGTVYCLKLN